MKLKLERVEFKETYTIGKLYINDSYFCDTLEDKNRDINKNGKFDNEEKKVYGETCIPFGTYNIKMTYAPKFKRELPWLQDVPSFSGILIHAGNTARDSAGCILVGKYTAPGQIYQTRKYESKLVERIKGAISKGEPISITIV